MEVWGGVQKVWPWEKSPLPLGKLGSEEGRGGGCREKKRIKGGSAQAKEQGNLVRLNS